MNDYGNYRICREVRESGVVRACIVGARRVVGLSHLA